METEKELQNKTLTYFSKYFDVYSEVWDSTSKSRIDLVFVHKENINYPIGIELKKTDVKKGKNLFAWIMQASRYSFSTFNIFGKMPILVAPQIAYDYITEGVKMKSDIVKFKQQNNVSTTLGQLGVGEVMRFENKNGSYYRFTHTGKVIWSEDYNTFDTKVYSDIMNRQNKVFYNFLNIVFKLINLK